MIRALLRRLPAPIFRPARAVYQRLRYAARRVRSTLLSTAPTVGRFDLGGTARQGRDPFDHVGPEAIGTIDRELRFNPLLLLQVRTVRQILARARLGHFMAQGQVERIEAASKDVAHNTLEYNLESAKSAPDLDRPSVMIGVVCGIERVWRNPGELDVLSIGPRTEMEIFALHAAGFSPKRVRALDLFSYSPYVDIGDMHATPYPDNSFDIVFLGWVLSYSRDQSIVAREVLRICRDRAIVVLAGDYSDDSRDRPIFLNQNTHMQSTAQLLELFSGRIGQVYFRHDPEPPNTAMVMTAFDVRKP